MSGQSINMISQQLLVKDLRLLNLLRHRLQMLLVLQIDISLLLLKRTLIIAKPQNDNLLLLFLLIDLSIEVVVLATDLSYLLVWQMHSA